MIRGVSSTITRTTEGIHQAGHITPEDSRRIYLLVGFVEYGNALANFQELLRTSTEEELQAMDRIVGEKDEFTVYTNLSKQYQSGPSTVSSPNDTSVDHLGLAWVIALARTEFGAMLAAYSDLASPFTAVPPHAFDAEAYRALLSDGAASHYWALVSDRALKKVSTTSPREPIVLAYSRRLVVARAMLSAAMRLGQQGYSDVQMRELSSWRESLDGLQAGFVAKIQLYLQSLTRLSTTSTTQDKEYVDACRAMLRAEARELKSGRATIQRFP